MKPIAIDVLIETRELSIEQLASASNLSPARVEAIVTGRWLASPAERRAIAEAFQMTPNDIVWGHTMSPRNVRYHRFGVPKKF